MGWSRVGIPAALLMTALLAGSTTVQAAEKKWCLTVGSDMNQRYCGMSERDCRAGATGGTGGFCTEDTSAAASADKPKRKGKQ
jgi:hypothetical protein